MSNTIINMSVAVVLLIVMFTVVMDVYLGTDTTGWSTTQITMTTTITVALLIAAIVLVFRAVTGRSG